LKTASGLKIKDYIGDTLERTRPLIQKLTQGKRKDTHNQGGFCKSRSAADEVLVAAPPEWETKRRSSAAESPAQDDWKLKFR
jgi:hypothetical protein